MDADDLTDELLDRFGDLPRSVENLFKVALLRAQAQKLFCESIKEQKGKVTFVFTSVSHEALLLLSPVYASRLSLSFSGKCGVTLILKEKENVLTQCIDLLHHLKEFTLAEEKGKEETK